MMMFCLFRKTAFPTYWALRDFSGDGKSDIIWHNTATGDTYALFMTARSLPLIITR